jgi:hypothetical protein
MNTTKIISILIILLISNSNLLANKNTKKKSAKWSDYQGEMNWADAKKKCISIGMRLPTRAEVEKAFKLKETNSWKKDGYWFWTSEEYSVSDVYYFDVGLGLVVDHLKEDVNHVRCIY